MKYGKQNVGILYFTNPASEAEDIGKIVDGVMRTVGRDVPVRKINTDYEVSVVEQSKPKFTPSLIFTNTKGNLEHIRVEGAQLKDISVEGVLGIVQDIINYNKSQVNG